MCTLRTLPALLAATALTLMSHAQPRDRELARTILSDERLDKVLDKAREVAATGFNAGDGYGEVWIRDLATFIDLACAVHPPQDVKDRLLTFFHFQDEDGNIPDGYIPKKKASVGYAFLASETMPEYLAHKNTVETDQESSLVLAFDGYLRATGDTGVSRETVNGELVVARLERALAYVRDHRMSERYGLVWGATTADWGDVQPEHEWGVRLDESSHRAIDIYDNALYLAAIDALLKWTRDEPEICRADWQMLRATTARNVEKHLWDEQREQFRPHVYLDGSPFPEDFDEAAIYYHGGTTIAMQAGLLTKAQARAALERMRANVKAAGAATIGLTLYPPYPDGFFKNPQMGAYSYQNGGDWTWFGGRTIQELIRLGLVADAYKELGPMVDRVLANDGFYEWYTKDNDPRGSGTFRGEAGVLYKAIQMLREWADEQPVE